MDELIKKLAEDVTNAAAPMITAQIMASVEQILKDREFCYTEAEAAKLLNIGEQALAEYRRKKEISCSIVIPQNKKGCGGRFVYKPEHLESFLRRREVLAIGEKRPNVSEFKKKAAA